MPHARKQIRDAVVAALVGATAAGGNVHATRIHPLEEQGLPAILVYTMDEQASADTSGASAILLRELRVAVEVAAQGVVALDDVLDGIIAEIEIALEANGALRALVLDFMLARTSIAKSGDGDKPSLGAVVDFTCLYRTTRSNPNLII